MTEEFDFKPYTPKNLTGDIEGRCNNILWNCKHPDCDYRFPNKDEGTCPICQTPRAYCSSYPAVGREKCRFHGGAALQGHHHPQYQGRGVSKHLPTRLLESYLLAYDDPDLLNFTQNIALLEMRKTELFEKLDETPGHKIWQQIGKVWQEYRKAESFTRKYGGRKHAKRMAVKLDELEDLILRGFTNSSLWQDITNIMEKQDRTKEREIKRLEKIEQFITPDQFKTLLKYLITSVRTHVKDPDAVNQIMLDLERLNWERKR